MGKNKLTQPNMKSLFTVSTIVLMVVVARSHAKTYLIQIEGKENLESTDYSSNNNPICSLGMLKSHKSCRALIPKWHFDNSKRKCVSVYYGGCNGTENLFNTEEECKQTCP